VKYPLKIAATYLSIHNTARHSYVPQPQRCDLHGLDNLQSYISMKTEYINYKQQPLA